MDREVVGEEGVMNSAEWTEIKHNQTRGPSQSTRRPSPNNKHCPSLILIWIQFGIPILRGVLYRYVTPWSSAERSERPYLCTSLGRTDARDTRNRR